MWQGVLKVLAAHALFGAVVGVVTGGARQFARTPQGHAAGAATRRAAEAGVRGAQRGWASAGRTVALAWTALAVERRARSAADVLGRGAQRTAIRVGRWWRSLADAPGSPVSNAELLRTAEKLIRSARESREPAESHTDGPSLVEEKPETREDAQMRLTFWSSPPPLYERPAVLVQPETLEEAEFVLALARSAAIAVLVDDDALILTPLPRDLVPVLMRYTSNGREVEA